MSSLFPPSAWPSSFYASSVSTHFPQTKYFQTVKHRRVHKWPSSRWCSHPPVEPVYQTHLSVSRTCSVTLLPLLFCERQPVFYYQLRCGVWLAGFIVPGCNFWTVETGPNMSNTVPVLTHTHNEASILLRLFPKHSHGARNKGRPGPGWVSQQGAL